MDSIYEMTMLYDFYGELLTANQKKVCRMHLLEDYSLSEMSQILNISRQGVHDSLRRALTALKEYENTLHLVARFNDTRERLEQIRVLAEKAEKADEAERTGLLEQIKACTLEIE